MKDAQGNVTQVGKADMSKLPAWVPQYQNIGKATGGSSQESATGAQGFVMFTTSDAPEAVGDFFKEQADKAGLGNTSRNKLSLNGQDMVTFEASDDTRKLTVTATKGSDGPETTVTVSYEQGTK